MYPNCCNSVLLVLTGNVIVTNDCRAVLHIHLIKANTRTQWLSSNEFRSEWQLHVRYNKSYTARNTKLSSTVYLLKEKNSAMEIGFVVEVITVYFIHLQSVIELYKLVTPNVVLVNLKPSISWCAYLEYSFLAKLLTNDGKTCYCIYM